MKPLYFAAALTITILHSAVISLAELRESRVVDKTTESVSELREFQDMPYRARSPLTTLGGMEHCGPWVRGNYHSIQVNVDELGCNIPGDAANEPSIAMNPNDPQIMAIGWRQFNTIESSFRQAGWGYTQDGGETWTFPGVLGPEFRSDPVLGADAQGNFYYYSIRCPDEDCGDVFKSIDGGATWSGPVFAFGGDKPWMAVDKTHGYGSGNVYAAAIFAFTRSVDGGLTFDSPSYAPLFYNTLDVGLDGEVYGASGYTVSRSRNALNPNEEAYFELSNTIAFETGGAVPSPTPNPGGLLAQPWVACDRSNSVNRGNVYVLRSINPPGDDPMDVMFAASSDRGETWTTPVRVNDDALATGSWQWFGMLSVAPNGRIDVAWNDTRASGVAHLSELYYAYSLDGGNTWSPNVAISPAFNSTIGYPEGQSKLGDYYHMVSDSSGANIAYAATFNGEQDVYFLHVEPVGADCNSNGVPDVDDIALSQSQDCNGDGTPDECHLDCNANGIADDCELLKGLATDCDLNGLLDDCEPDCDQSGAGDICEILVELLPDCNLNRVPDSCDLAGGANDCNENDFLDSCDIVAGRSMDINFNRIPDECEPQIIRVRSGGNCPCDGRTWESAFNDLNVALNYSTEASPVVREVWVATGTYIPTWPTGTVNTFTITEGLTVLGGFSGNELIAAQRDFKGNQTILSGDVNSDDGPNFSNRTDNREGVVYIPGGKTGAVLDGFTIRGAGTGFHTGRAINLYGKVELRNCIIADNITSQGAGVEAHDGEKAFYRCEFKNNAVSRYGGAIWANDCSVKFEECVFVANAAAWAGGAYRDDNNLTTMNNVLFVGNSSGSGGAISSLLGGIEARNCTFVGNIAMDNGGGVFISGPSLFADSIFWENRDSTGNSQTGQIWTSATSLSTIQYTCVQGLTPSLPGVFNISDDPLFTDIYGPDGDIATNDGNLRLLPDSPCIDTGDPIVTNQPGKDDLDGHVRVLCDRVDMGAYEFGIGDYNCDRVVELTDFAQFPLCLTGPAPVAPYESACAAYDYVAEVIEDVDLLDFAGLQRRGFDGP